MIFFAKFKKIAFCPCLFCARNVLNHTSQVCLHFVWLQSWYNVALFLFFSPYPSNYIWMRSIVVTCWHHMASSLLVQLLACCLFDNMPLPGAVLSYCQFDIGTSFSEIWINELWFLSKENVFEKNAAILFNLICCGLVTSYGDRDLNQHWLR